MAGYLPMMRRHALPRESTCHALPFEAHIHLDSTLLPPSDFRPATMRQAVLCGDRDEVVMLKNALPPSPYLMLSGPLRQGPRLQPDRGQHAQALSRQGRQGKRRPVGHAMFIICWAGQKCHPETGDLSRLEIAR